MSDFCLTRRTDIMTWSIYCRPIKFCIGSVEYLRFFLIKRTLLYLTHSDNIEWAQVRKVHFSGWLHHTQHTASAKLEGLVALQKSLDNLSTQRAFGGAGGNEYVQVHHPNFWLLWSRDVLTVAFVSRYLISVQSLKFVYEDEHCYIFMLTYIIMHFKIIL